jgi:hypothetical protein
MVDIDKIIDNINIDDDFYECIKCGTQISIIEDVCEVCGFDHSKNDERIDNLDYWEIG